MTLNNTAPVQLLKSITTFAGAVAFAVISPATTGIAETITGVHAVPLDCCNARLVTSAPEAVPGPLLPITIGHVRAFVGPDFRPILPPMAPCEAVTDAIAVFPIPPLI